MTVNAKKDLRHPAKWWHNHLTSQYQGFKTNYEHTEVVETELGLNPTILQVYRLVTRDPDRKMRSLVLNPRRREEGDSDQKCIRYKE